MSITTADIKQLRELTGAGILDCKKVLEETGGDVDKAIELLRRKGLAAASKKASREANEGLIGAWISADGRTGVLLEVNCETDFVARTDDFKSLVDNLGRQVLEQSGVGSAEALLAASYLGNQTKTVAEQITETIAKLGENIMLRRVVRFDLKGDGMLDSYVHPNNRIGVLVDVAGGSSANPRFVELAHDLALHIAAAGPRHVSESDIPAEAIEAERDIFRSQIAEDKKPENIKERIIDGKLSKWYSEITLLNQPFVKDGDLTIQQLLQKYGKELNGEIKVRRFARFELGAS